MKIAALPVLLVIVLFGFFAVTANDDGAVSTSSGATTTTVVDSAQSAGSGTGQGTPDAQAFADDEEGDSTENGTPTLDTLISEAGIQGSIGGARAPEETAVGDADSTEAANTTAASVGTTAASGAAAPGSPTAASSSAASSPASAASSPASPAAATAPAANAPASSAAATAPAANAPAAPAAPAPAPSGAAPVTITTPTCGALGAATTRTAPFTGLSASIPANLPAVVIKVSNNSSASRATLIGLDQADIVFEERIEARATRFFSIFHSSLPENVGPVRSGRTTDIQVAQNLRGPVFGYSGSNEGVERQLAHAEGLGIFTLFRNNDRSPFARDSRWSAPDNLFVSPAGLGSCGSGNPVPIFSYGGATSGTAQSASSVSFDARSPYQFDWNGSTWVRSQSGSQHVTREGDPLATENVVVLFAPVVQSQIDRESVDTQTIGSGTAWILRDGTITVGSYNRALGRDPYSLFDGNGSAVNLAPGQTWVVLAPEGTASFN